MSSFDRRVIKNSLAILDYTFDYNPSGDSAYLDVAGGEQINSSTWSVQPSGLTIDSDSNTTTTTTVTISGGTHPIVYGLTNKIVTSKGRTEYRTLAVKIWDE